MAKKLKANKPSLLYRRLKEAMENGSKVRIEAEESYYGIPINLTREFVEVLVLVPPDEFDEEDEGFKRVTWLVRLSSIFAIAYATEYWSTERLEKMLDINTQK